MNKLIGIGNYYAYKYEKIKMPEYSRSKLNDFPAKLCSRSHK